MKLNQIYEYLVYGSADPRSNGFFLIETPWPLLVIVSFYLYFVKVCGPRFMRDRQPYQIDGLIKAYNVIQIIWNLYIFGYIFPIIAAAQRSNSSIWCLPLSFSNEPFPVLLLGGFRHYFYNKLFDLSDTIFFVLKKKNSHISYMHVYHHVAMCFASYIALKYGPGGCPVSVGILNAFIHTFMYTYYLLSLTRLKKWLWWKRYLTQMQMIQFLLLLIYNLPVFFISSCYYNPVVSALAVVQSIYFLYLFGNYYFKTYFHRKIK